jgi:hypothetical protein
LPSSSIRLAWNLIPAQCKWLICELNYGKHLHSAQLKAINNYAESIVLNKKTATWQAAFMFRREKSTPALQAS